MADVQRLLNQESRVITEPRQKMVGVRAWWVWVTVWVCVAASNPVTSDKDKLLYILMDGLRWDYVDLQDASVLPGFQRVLREGVRARWTDPLFPVLSYPTWTTLSTGRYAESHGIVGNYFYDAKEGDVFSLFDEDSTGKQKFGGSEPPWTNPGERDSYAGQFLWSRCDVPIDGVTTSFCEHFVYTEHTDFTGHNFGPDSEEVRQAMRDLDECFQQPLRPGPGHGGIWPRLADKGAFMSIKAKAGKAEQVFGQVSAMPGVRAYRRADIPARYHYQASPYIHDMILVADKGHYIMGSRSDVQLPPRDDRYVAVGAHGFDPDEQDMKGIFFARGPAFVCGSVVEPLHVVDVYQVLTHVLHLTPQPHNGTWSRVQPLFRTQDSPACTGGGAGCLDPQAAMLLPALAFIARRLMTE
ncbi:Ectonucleotide pyrophosphatase/phosphodiesterase family member 6 [Chionoecetes opilio]|uniref:Ectonucleotide pyrophosphatase/phosphodiesterase family member 6 n=1 Tax=Chionoecetes opilio TaxID=41210 RepID=A0A8J5CHT0_CHIOP|nr:Ectonucleotide pyrophosphatase/phosphodiesterase family member 6 [Chionoecetes opilio]